MSPQQLATAMAVVAALVMSPPVRAGGAVRPVACDDARFVAGANIPDTSDKDTGDVRTVEAILDAAGARVGYRYTLRDGRTYVADRARAALTFDGLMLMNDLVNRMSPFRYNAFDPRDNGYTVFPVRWRAAEARRLRVALALCIVKR